MVDTITGGAQRTVTGRRSSAREGAMRLERRPRPRHRARPRMRAPRPTSAGAWGARPSVGALAVTAPGAGADRSVAAGVERARAGVGADGAVAGDRAARDDVGLRLESMSRDAITEAWSGPESARRTGRRSVAGLAELPKNGSNRAPVSPPSTMPTRVRLVARWLSEACPDPDDPVVHEPGDAPPQGGQRWRRSLRLGSSSWPFNPCGRGERKVAAGSAGPPRRRAIQHARGRHGPRVGGSCGR